MQTDGKFIICHCRYEKESTIFDSCLCINRTVFWNCVLCTKKCWNAFITGILYAVRAVQV